MRLTSRATVLARVTSASTLLLGLTLAAAPAAAQIPPTRTATESSLAPMPTPPPIHSTPPDLRGSSSVAAPYTRAPPSHAPGDASSTPPGPASAPAAGNSTPAGGGGPAPDSQPERALDPRSSGLAVTADNPADGPDGPRRRRLWGEGSTLLPRDARVGIYIAPAFKVSGVLRRPALMLGADFAVIIGERFAIGAAGFALATPLPAARNDGRTFNMRMQYAGLTLGVALVRVKFFKLGVRALVGGGRVCLNDERIDRCVNRAALFVTEPELGVSFALTRSLQLALSGGYRVAVAQAWSGPSDALLRGFTGTLALRLGRF